MAWTYIFVLRIFYEFPAIISLVQRDEKENEGGPMTGTPGPLAGVRILDLSRILAGPTATQLLGDLGADVIKVERPGVGDDTRTWGPPFIKDANGAETTESAYYLSSNRNKRSVAIDIGKPGGQALVRRLASHADVLVENFKVGTLAKYGLSYGHMKDDLPGLVYCSITGFGQTGPYRNRPGYDYLAQGMGGLMSITGERDGGPLKAGIGIADVMCGMYATIAMLAALRHRELTGDGQHIDIGLMDTQVAWLINEGVNYLTSGQVPRRLGNAHPNVVPYQTFATSDGDIIVAVGNDGQFVRFCEFAGAPDLAEDSRFLTNNLRIVNRDTLIPLIEPLIAAHPSAYWLDGLESAGVPCGPVNTIDQVFADPHVLERNMKIAMDHPLAADGINLIGNPINFSETPVTYRRPPPTVGQHTDEVLSELLGMDEKERDALRAEKII